MQYPQIGMRVLVPLAKKEIVGIVYREHTEPVDATIKVRDIICTLDLEPFVTQEQLR